MNKIASYRYTYGAGSIPNREIEFHRKDNNDAKSIYAKVFALISGTMANTCEVAGENIFVEVMSTSNKVQEYIKARQTGQAPCLGGVQLLKDYDKKHQNEILKDLEPVGKRRIEIVNTIGASPKFEVVERLSIFDPS